MSLPTPIFRVALHYIWEDLVNDFLELSSRLSPEERKKLLYELKDRGIEADSIRAHPCFSIDERIVVISDEPPIKEFWIFDTKRKRVQRKLFK